MNDMATIRHFKRQQAIHYGVRRLDVSDPMVVTVLKIALKDYIDRQIVDRRFDWRSMSAELRRGRRQRYKVARRLLMKLEGDRWGCRAEYNPAKRIKRVGPVR